MFALNILTRLPASSHKTSSPRLRWLDYQISSCEGNVIYVCTCFLLYLNCYLSTFLHFTYFSAPIENHPAILQLHWWAKKWMLLLQLLILLLLLLYCVASLAAVVTLLLLLLLLLLYCSANFASIAAAADVVTLLLILLFLLLFLLLLLLLPCRSLWQILYKYSKLTIPSKIEAPWTLCCWLHWFGCAADRDLLAPAVIRTVYQGLLSVDWTSGTFS